MHAEQCLVIAVGATGMRSFSHDRPLAGAGGVHAEFISSSLAFQRLDIVPVSNIPFMRRLPCQHCFVLPSLH
ncbi:protein of unknown function [Bradyrhizobium vignae]|uniref:Uncharacterized protein n=1 Tax=Bradyrhizobium vignae TaxID=1549949 RepID=A0A2U3PSG0_9BRAD|nr:protein of unknown function [Bradyrhizobium vignae]